MTPDQAAAYVFAQAACALAEIEAMKAANIERETRGHSPAFGEDAFLGICDRYCINHNAVLQLYQEASER